MNILKYSTHRRLSLAIFGLFVSVLGLSCKKFVQIDTPSTLAQTVDVFSSDQSAIAAAVGLYHQMTSANLLFSNGALTIYPGLTADEIINVNPNSDYDGFKNNSIPATSSLGIGSRLWNSAFKNIYHANAVIEGLGGATALTPAIRDQLTGEMLFVRAFHYFYLTNLFGDVPLELTTDYKINGIMPRTPSEDVLKQVISDLIKAQSLLSADYSGGDRSRPNKWTATAFLARVYLYQGDWANAELNADLVINSGMYSLETDLNNVFLIASNEAIWQLSKQNGNTAEGVTFIPAGNSKPTFVITNSLLSAFESGDGRLANWVKVNNVNAQSYYYPAKYKKRTPTPVTEYYTVLRLAEQFLIRAEARAQQNNLVGTNSAASDLNAIRNRAGLENTVSTIQQDLLNDIEHERFVELFAEWGHRWFDLKRTNRIDIVLGAEKPSNWQSTDALYPLPLSEIQKNPFLTQNASY